MPERTMPEIMDGLGSILDDLDQIARVGHATYRSYPAAVLIEHDIRAQASCTYCHMVAEADRRFLGRPGVHPLDLSGLKLWHFTDEDIVIRLKKMDEDGHSRRYPTRQAKNFDRGWELPGLPFPPVRLTAGYLLDATSTNFIRAQVAQPNGRSVLWCAAIVNAEGRPADAQRWEDATRQGRL